jgi:hypothetical protein
MFGKKPVSILIGVRGADHVLIEPHPKMVSGRFEAEIYIRCGTWSGHLVGIFVGGELHKFGRDVSSLCEGLKCTAVLKPNEPRLQMTLNVEGKDLISVRGFARQSMESRTVLEFEFDVDRAELASAGNALLVAEHA